MECVRKNLALALGFMLLMLAGFTPAALAQKGNSNSGTVVECKKALSTDGRQVELTVSGQLPAQATVNATAVQRTAVQGKQVKGAYDITIKNGNAKWQPQAGQPVTVTISDPNFTDGEMMDVYHEGDNGNEFVATVTAQNGAISFPAKSFSVYIVTQVGDEARLKVNFYQNSDQVTNNTPVVIYVKKTDLTGGYFPSIVYDPGAGTLPSGVAFFGWVKEKPNYTIADTASTTALTIANIRTEVQSILNNEDDPVEEGDEINYYALLFKTYIISYYDGTPATIGSDNIYFRADATQTQYSYTISKTYVPTSSEYNFMGWVVKGEVDESTGTIIYPTAGNIVNPQSDGLYQFGDQIIVQGNVNFSVDEEQGHWLVFDENGKGATYNAPQFVKNGDVTSDADLLPMARPGYDFDGWYTEPECTNEFEFGGELTDRTIIYAKWIAHENAGYSVIVWMQKLTYTTDPNNPDNPNADYDFGHSYRIENGNVGTHPNVVVGTVGAASVTINGNSVSETGFHYAGTNQSTVTITPEGTTVVNVYLDRDVVTLNFYTYYTYTEATSNTGTQYGLVNGQHVELTSSGNTYTATYSGTRYTRSGSEGNYTYTATTSTSNNVTQYGLVNGDYVELTRTGNWNYTWTFTYTGTRYTRSGNSWTLYKSFNGRYGSTLAQNDYTWPAEYDWRASGGNNGSTSGTRTTFLDAFLPASTSTTVNFYGSDPTGDATAYFYKQNPDGNGYTLANYVSVSSGNTFNLSDKYNGFKCKAWNTSNNTSSSSWTLVGGTYQDGNNIYYDAYPNQTGNQGITIGNELHVYFDVLKYELEFASGSTYTGNNGTNEETGAPTYGTHEETLSPEELHTESNVAYGLSIANFASYVPDETTWPEGYVFDGWYADDNCTTPYTFSTMPANNVMLYAKWRQIRFRVFLHPNALLEETNERDETLDWGSESQKMCFGVAWGDKVSVPTGRRFGFEFIGWFTDPEFQHPFDKDAIIMNNTNVPATPVYDKTVDMTDDMDKWGLITNLGNGAYNSDVDRPWVQRKFDLYAQWRITVEGALGIDLVYDANGGTNAPEDQNHYLDAAKACAAAACKAPTNKVFSHWVLQHYNCTTNAFEDTDIELYPGSTFIIHRSDARIIVSQWCDPEDRTQIFTIENPTPCNNTTPPADTYEYEDPETGEVEERGYTKIYNAEYTIKLRAEYLDVEQPLPTFIIWYNNYTATGVDPILRQDGNTGQEGDTHEELIVNYAVSIPTPAARPGYTFKGWSKFNITSTSNVPTTHETGENDPNFLVYVPGENGAAGTYTSVDGVPATEVAADEENPYDYLYAVWEANGYTVHFDDNGANATETMEDQLFEFDQEQALTTNTFTYEDHCFQGWATSATSTTVAYTDGQTVSNLTETPGAVVNLYAVWEEKVTPVFDDILVTEYCLNAQASTLPTSSKEVITEDATIPVVNGTWQDADGAPVTSVSTATVGTVTLTFVPEEGACAKPVDIEFTIKPLPNVVITTTPEATAICDGTTSTLKATGAASYQWSANAGNSTEDEIEVDAAGTYTVTGTGENGCTNTAEVTITIKELPDIQINAQTSTTSVCYGESATLSATGGESYVWSNQATGSNITVSNMTATQTFTVTGTGANGCTKEAQVTVTVNPLPTIVTLTVPTDAQVLCPNKGTYEVSAEAANGTEPYTYEWTGATPTTENGPVANVTQEEGDDNCTPNGTLYTVSVVATDANGCASAAAQGSFTVQMAPGGFIINDEDAVDNVTVDCPALADVLPTEYLPIVKDACDNTLEPVLTEVSDFPECGGEGATVTYTYTYTDCAGNTADWVFTYNISAPANPTLTLQTDPVTATPAGDCKYKIPEVGYTAEAACNGTVSVTQTPAIDSLVEQTAQEQTITIKVTATDGCGSSTEKTTTVTIPAKPTVTITPSSTSTCYGNNIILEATEGFESYSWSNQLSSATITAEYLTKDTTFTVTVTDANGCEASASQDLTVDEIGTATISGADAVCMNGDVELTAPEGVSYIWNTGATTQSITLSKLTADTTCSVTVVDASGCTSFGEKTVTVNPLPVVELTVPTTEQDLCPNQEIYEVSATVTSGVEPYTFTWSGDATAQEDNLSHADVFPPADGDCTPNGHTYTVSVVVTDDNGCASATAEESFTVLMATGGITMTEVPTQSIVTCAQEIVEPTLPTVTDACGNTLEPIDLDISPEIPSVCDGEQTYTYTYEDCVGNSVEWEYTFIFQAPVLTFDGEITDVEGIDACYSAALADEYLLDDAAVMAMFSSDCELDEITVSHVDATREDNNDCDWEIQRIFTIWSACTTVYKTQVLTGGDQTAPTFTAPAAYTTTFNPDGTYNIDPEDAGEVEDATDNCTTITESNIDYVDEIEENEDGSLTITRTWTVTDDCELSTSHDQIITVNLIADPVVVYITGDQVTETYNGSWYSAVGYTVDNVTINGEATTAYTENDFTFSSNAYASRKDAGRTDMGISSSDFQNTNPIFANVTFEVEDGFVQVNKKEITIFANASKPYDGTRLEITYNDVTVTPDLAAGDELAAGILYTDGTDEGEYTCTQNFFMYAMALDAIQEGFVIENEAGLNMNANYSPHFDVTLTITSPDCQGVTYQDHFYPAVQIGTQCWLAENLRNTEDWDGNPVANYSAYDDDEANMEVFGYLYTWYSAVGVEEDSETAPETIEGTDHVQGICPEGWAVPTHEDFVILRDYTTGQVRRLREIDPEHLYWFPGTGGVEPNYHFNARAGGFYNSVTGNYERMYLDDYYWESTSDPNTTEITVVDNNYACDDLLFKTSKRSDKRSIRCIRVETSSSNEVPFE